jgi:hypothetical protein
MEKLRNAAMYLGAKHPKCIRADAILAPEDWSARQAIRILESLYTICLITQPRKEIIE